MAAYDPKRPRPAQLTEDAAPVDALLEPTVVPEPEPAVVPSAPVPDVAPAPEDGPVADAGARPGEVPVAPAPEVGTTNRAVLYASIGVAALVTALLVVLRIRSRRASGGSAAD